MNDTPVTLKTQAGDFEYPVLEGTVGPDVVDIRKLYAQTGMFTYDPGFTSTGSCQSAITYIDGEKGILLHRGYPIDQLAEKSTFMEVAYLLLHGELPKKDELDTFVYTISRHTMLHEQLATFYRGFRRDAHPMAIMCGVVGALSAFYHDSTDITDPQQRMIASHRLIAKMPTIAAMAFKYSVGQPFLYPDNSLSYTGNFLRMTFGVPAEPYEVNPIIENAMRRIFILHADHEQNASTSTVRLAGSSGANPFACIAAGIACLWGPAHGGANEAALNMLREIGDVKRIPDYIARAKDKDDPFRLMGFGHRVYKNFDPRAKVMKETAEEVLKELNISDPVLDVAQGARAHRAQRRIFHREKALPERRFLFGRDPQRDRFPDRHVHGVVRPCPHGRLGRAVERDDFRPRAEDRTPATALHRCDAAGLYPLRQALGNQADGRESVKRAPCPGSLTKVISPPIERARRRAIASPRPDPGAVPATSPRSKMRCCSS